MTGHGGRRARPIGTAVSAALAAIASVALAAQDRTVFRASADVVTVDVLVRAGNAPVSGLTARDFLLTDNGVRQTVDVTSMRQWSIDVTIAVDTSGSMFDYIADVERHVRETVARLQPGDRVRLLTFSDRVSAGGGFLSAGPELTFPPLGARGSTSLNDAIAAALVAPADPTRRHLAIVFTDGIDTSSVLGTEALRSLARRADTLLNVFTLVPKPNQYGLPPPPPPLMHYNTRRIWAPDRVGGLAAVIGADAVGDLARETGGVATTAYTAGDMQAALDAFRSSYVLRYQASGVTAPGWHAIRVGLTRSGRYDIRARSGYDVR